MATIRALSNLFRALGADDLAAARAAAVEMCSLEEKSGHRAAARQLRGALNGTTGALGAPIQAANSLMSAALLRVNSPLTFAEVSLTPTQRDALSCVQQEWRAGSVLEQAGIRPRSKLIFHGPPGCGKSLAAQALGLQLGLPVYLVRFDAVIGAFLGQTAIHLRQLFAFTEANPCVLLLDEIDALGKKRGNPLDVGELDRIVISLLQELEHARPRGLVIATTNLPGNLDQALWRRFDLAIEFKRPNAKVLNTFARTVAGKFKIRLSADVLREASAAASYADAERIVIDNVRSQLIKNFK